MEQNITSFYLPYWWTVSTVKWDNFKVSNISCNTAIVMLASLPHRYFHKINQIFAFAPFSSKHVKQVSPQDPPSSWLSNNLKLWPFFQQALDAIDGSCIHATTHTEHHETCCNWKGFISQNHLFWCSFDILFSYVLAGWEGLASDAWVYASAISEDLIVSDGWHLLADAGFPHCKELLVPYCGVHYHLAEWGWANLWYVNNICNTTL